MAKVGGRGKDIQWHDNWIIENYWNYKEVRFLKTEYEKVFETTVNPDVFRHHCLKLGFTHGFTKEQDLFLTNNYPIYGHIVVTDMFNKEFNQSRSCLSIQQRCKRALKLKVSDERKRLSGRENSVRNGYGNNKIGSLRVHHGYTYIKYKDDLGAMDNWKLLHHIIYEKHYGKIPNGYNVVFVDNDPSNFDIDNLACIPVKYHGLMNGNCLKSSNPQITKAAIKWCELYEIYTERN